MNFTFNEPCLIVPQACAANIPILAAICKSWIMKAIFISKVFRLCCHGDLSFAGFSSSPCLHTRSEFQSTCLIHSTLVLYGWEVASSLQAPTTCNVNWTRSWADRLTVNMYTSHTCWPGRCTSSQSLNLATAQLTKCRQHLRIVIYEYLHTAYSPKTDTVHADAI